MRVGSLFAGIGGFDLAARWMGWETAWFSEIEPYASRVLSKNFPGVPNLGDITKIKRPAPVDILCGGFPCQDISFAGKGAGLEGQRSGLWFHFARLIDETRPRYVVAENVAALRSRGLDQVLGSLDALGYDAEWHCIPAAYVGAPHRRDRIWIVGYPRGECEQCLLPVSGIEGGSAPASNGTLDTVDAGCCGACVRGSEDVDDAECSRLEGHAGYVCPAGREAAPRPATASGIPCGADARRWWSAEPTVGRVAYGIPNPVDELRCLGNAIVPQVALLIFQAIAINEARQSVGLSHSYKLSCSST